MIDIRRDQRSGNVREAVYRVGIRHRMRIGAGGNRRVVHRVDGDADCNGVRCIGIGCGSASRDPFQVDRVSDRGQNSVGIIDDTNGQPCRLSIPVFGGDETQAGRIEIGIDARQHQRGGQCPRPDSLPGLS